LSDAIHLTVTIIVSVVTDLRAGADAPLTLVSPNARLYTALDPGSATARVAATAPRLSWNAVTARIRVAIAIIVQAITDIRPLKGRVAVDPSASKAALAAHTTLSATGADQLFIDLTVTVIIEVVADLLVELLGGTLSPVSSRAETLTRSTGADAGLRDVVYDTITIIIQAITDLLSDAHNDLIQHKA